MARKEATITIDTAGRDQGKTFKVKEMSALQAEKWATRALLALLKSGIEIPDDIAAAGLAGVAAMGIRAFGGLDYRDAEPLLEEMMTCCSYLPNINQPLTALTGPSMLGQIEEVSTLLRLREGVLSLHLNFSLSDYRSKLMTARPVMGASIRNTETSLAPSGQ
jgi:hypothetical protein